MTSTGVFIDVTLNGEARQVPADLSVHDLLLSLSLPVDRVAVELNRTIVRKRDWLSVVVTTGAQLEIVEFVGGG